MARLARWFNPAFGISGPAVPARTTAAREPKRGSETPGSGAAVITRTRTQTKRPNMYRVLLLNDDYTPMMFVVDILEDVFQKPPAEAYRIMMQVHVNGRGIAGSYTWEIAETKADKVAGLAREAGFPLKAAIEEA